MSAAEESNDPEAGAWFCIRTQPKRERVAAGSLRELPGVQVLLPQASYIRKNARGKRRVTEPLFPNYLFAQFDPEYQQRAIKYAKGVSYILRRGQELADVPNAIISDLLQLSQDGLVVMQDMPLAIGDQVKVIGGIFQGVEADIVELAPARERVRILLEILGRNTLVELSMDEVDRPHTHPLHQ